VYIDCQKSHSPLPYHEDFVSEHRHPWAPTIPVVAPLPVLILAPPAGPRSTPHPQPVLAFQLAPNWPIPGPWTVRPNNLSPISHYNIEHSSKFRVHFFVWCFAMEAWRSRLANARATFLEDNEDDEVSIAMALG
jgi:hypothetical protein